MKVKGINWLITCPERFGEMSRFLEEVMGLTRTNEGTPVTDTRLTRYVQYQLPNGDMVEIVDGDASVREDLKAPVVQFEVDDVSKARREMEDHGIEFISPLYHSQGDGWTYFKAPNGQVYAIAGKYKELS